MDIAQQREEIAEEAGGADRPAKRIGDEAVNLLRVAAQPVEGCPDRRERTVVRTEDDPVQQYAAVTCTLQPELQRRQ
ncbi:hypothetical protein D3C73_1415380 [compost metagenome]